MGLVNHRCMIARNDMDIHSSSSPLAPAQSRIRGGGRKFLTSLEKCDSTRVVMQYIVLGSSKISLAEFDEWLSLGNFNIRRHQARSFGVLEDALQQFVLWKAGERIPEVE